MPTPVRLDRRALAVVLVFAAAQDAAFALIFLSSMNHYLLDVLKTSAGAPGFALALYGGTKLVTHPLAGRLLDRTSPRLVFRLAVAVQVAAIVLHLAFRGLPMFLVMAMLMAAGSAAMWPLIYDAVSRTQPVAGHGRAAGILSLAGYLSTGVGLAVGVLLSGNLTPWRTAVVVAGLMVVLPLLLQGEPALERTGTAPHEQRQKPRRGSLDPGVALFAAVIFLDYACIASIAGIYGPYVRLTLHITLLKTTLLLIPAGGAALLSLLVASRISRPNRRFLEMAVLYVLASIGAFALASTTSPGLAAGFAVITALGLGGIAPIVAATMLDLGGEEGRGLLIGSLMSVEGAGSIAGPGVVAVVADLSGPRAAFGVVGAGLAALVALTLFASSLLRIRKATGSEGNAPPE